MMKEELASRRIEFQTNSSDFQKACNDLYSKLQATLDKYVPLRRITVTDRDPKFVTPYIKTLLRKRNKLMRTGKITEANTIADKVGAQIIKNNTDKMKNQDHRKSSKEMWKLVNETPI